jgi:C2H2 type zinc finger protein
VTTVCGICGRELENEDATAGHRHVERATDEAALTCMVCGESFVREEDLVRHQGQDHVGVDPPDEERAVP